MIGKINEQALANIIKPKQFQIFLYEEKATELIFLLTTPKSCILELFNYWNDFVTIHRIGAEVTEQYWSQQADRSWNQGL